MISSKEKTSRLGKCIYYSINEVTYLVHCEISVVEIAAASLEANFGHAVVNQKEITQLQ